MSHEFLDLHEIKNLYTSQELTLPHQTKSRSIICFLNNEELPLFTYFQKQERILDLKVIEVTKEKLLNAKIGSILKYDIRLDYQTSYDLSQDNFPSAYISRNIELIKIDADYWLLDR